MSGHDTDIQWFIARNGKQHGPVSDLELRKLIELSHLKATDLLWRQGFADWRAAVSVFPALAEPSRTPASAPAAVAASSPSAAAPVSPAPAAEPQAVAPSHAIASASPGPSSSLQSAPATAGAPVPASLGAFGPAGAKPDPGAAWHPGGEPRSAEPGTRPFGTPTAARTAAPFAAPAPAGPRASASAEMMAPSRAYEPRPARGRKALAVAAGLLAMTGTGAWIASQYSDDIFTYVQMDDGEVSDGPPTVKADMMPSREPPSPGSDTQQAEAIETALQTPPSAPGASIEEIDRRLQARPMWVTVKQEFPEWYQTRVAEVARLTAEQKDQAEITRYLIGELVTLRRENARHALAASTLRHKELAAAFLANLKQLALESGDGCYDFISKGEASATVIARMGDPAKSAEIEAQMVAIVTAISEGRKQPTEHSAPIKTDYDVLAGELGRLGWTQADMQLFANPKELAKAPRSRVCSMLQDWFTAHLAIQDPSTQERLLFETLKPVISG